MPTTTTAELIDVVNTFTGERICSSGNTQRLTVCSVERWGLRIEYPTPDHPLIESEAAWLLSDVGLRLTYYRRRSRHAEPAPTVLTAVKVQRDTRSWRTTDLLLGLELLGDGQRRFAGSGEFAAAVTHRTLTPSDADLALKTVHRVMEELSYCGNDVDLWLARQGIVDSWPPR